MADLIALRAQLASEASNLNLAKQTLDELQTELDNAEGDLPPQLLIKLRQEVIAQARVVLKAAGGVGCDPGSVRRRRPG